MSPFFAVYGQNPRSGSEISEPPRTPAAPASTYFEKLDAEDFIHKFRQIDKFLIENIKLQSAEYEFQANKSRSAARIFQPGDLVWLNLKNIKSLRPSRKLDYKNGGPFKVIKPVSHYAYKLELPKSLRIHPVFHVSLLSPVSRDPLPGQTLGLPPTIEARDNDAECEVERILESKWINGEIHYLVRWKEFGPEEDWFVPASQSSGFQDLIQEFHELNPFAPHPSEKPPPASKKKLPRRSSARLRGG